MRHPVVERYVQRHTCTVPGCGARVKAPFKMCRVCRMMEAVYKARQRARATGPSTDGDVQNGD